MGIDRPLIESTCFNSAQSFGEALDPSSFIPSDLSFDQNGLSPKASRILLGESAQIQIERNILSAHQKTVFDSVATNFIW
jgi:hypothetical protein